MSADENKSFWMESKGFIALIAICIVIFAVVYSLTWRLFTSPHEAGDTAGLVNGLFSALAFAGVIYAIFLQKHELGLQRKELQQTAAELKAQRTEFETQNKTMKRQRFENTFFNMLQLQQQLTDNIYYSYKERQTTVEIKGREVFYRLFENVPIWSSKGYTYQGMYELIRALGLQEYEDSFIPSYFDHYFRHLYRILKFVAKSDLIEDEDRYEYAGLIRALLSRYELVWLYYNALSVYGYEKFKPLIEDFHLLKNLREDLLVPDVKLPRQYKSEAFG